MNIPTPAPKKGNLRNIVFPEEEDYEEEEEPLIRKYRRHVDTAMTYLVLIYVKVLTENPSSQTGKVTQIAEKILKKQYMNH